MAKEDKQCWVCAKTGKKSPAGRGQAVSQAAASEDWTVDSGANDWLANGKLSTAGPVTRSQTPCSLRMAKGRTLLKNQVPVKPPGVKQKIQAIHNPDGMNLAPMGKMVEDLDHLVFWGKQEGFHMWERGGDELPTYVENYLPKLGTPTRSSAAVSVLEHMLEECNDELRDAVLEAVDEAVEKIAEMYQADVSQLPTSADSRTS